jgi:hypothetical protein
VEQVPGGAEQAATPEEAMAALLAGWTDELGAAYVNPIYLGMMGHNALRANSGRDALLRDLSARITEDEIRRLLLAFNWRPRVMGGWYAAIRGHEQLASVVHAALVRARSPKEGVPLLVATVLMPSEESAGVLLQKRDSEERFTLPMVDAALQWLRVNGHSLLPVVEVEQDQLDRFTRLVTYARSMRRPS